MNKIVYKYCALSPRAHSKNTCDDFALELLIDFAAANFLPVSIENGTGTLKAADDKFTTKDHYKTEVKQTTGARDFQRDNNTTKIHSAGQLKSGDLILNTKGEVAGHVQVVTDVLSNGEFIVVQQGSTTEAMGRAKALLTGNNGADPSNNYYIGVSGPSVGVYSMQQNGYVYSSPRKTTSATADAFKTFNVSMRQWNFYQWKKPEVKTDKK